MEASTKIWKGKNNKMKEDAKSLEAESQKATRWLRLF